MSFWVEDIPGTITFSSVKINFKNLDIKEKEKDNSNSQYYIKLGLLLKFIEENLLYYSENENRPLVQIDYDLDNNFCLTYPQQFPANPMVSLIPVGYQDENSKWNYLGDFLGQEFFVSNISQWETTTTDVCPIEANVSLTGQGSSAFSQSKPNRGRSYSEVTTANEDCTNASFFVLRIPCGYGYMNSTYFG